MRRYVSVGAGLGPPGQSPAVLHTHLGPDGVEGRGGGGVPLGGVLYRVSPQLEVEPGGAGGFLQEIMLGTVRGTSASRGALSFITSQVRVRLGDTGPVLEVLLGGGPVQHSLDHL